MSAEEDAADGFELVMPFVTVRSVDGPHDDDAYAAGWEMCTLDRDLSSGDLVHEERVVRTASLPQADLIAMRHGYSVTTIETVDDTWTLIAISYSAAADLDSP